MPKSTDEPLGFVNFGMLFVCMGYLVGNISLIKSVAADIGSIFLFFAFVIFSFFANGSRS